MRAHFLVLLALLPLCQGFIWNIDRIDYFPETYVFSELYMYGPQEAPFGLDFFKTEISLGLKVRLTNVSVGHKVFMQAAFLRTQNSDRDPAEADALVQQLADDLNICDKSFSDESADGSEATQVKVYTFEGTRSASDLSFHVTEDYFPRQSGIAAVLLAPCQADSLMSSSFDEMHTVGTITFRNPYGYLPGMYFGYVPFEGARATIFVAFGLVYGILLYLNRPNLMYVHFAIASVIIVACLEATLWFAAYVDINKNGTPYCCPLPSLVISAMVLEMFRRTASRALMLSLCLGWGIVDEKLSTREIVSVGLLSMCYLISTILADTKDIIAYNDVEHETGHSMWWTFPSLLLDLTFLVWIYLALDETMKKLVNSQQTVKLALYTKLAYVMGIFVGLVSILTILIVMAKQGVFTWPWQVNWLESVAWEILNLGVLIAVTVIWAPNDRSKLMASSYQLSMDDDDDDAPPSELELGTFGIDEGQKTEADDFET